MTPRRRRQVPVGGRRGRRRMDPMHGRRCGGRGRRHLSYHLLTDFLLDALLTGLVFRLEIGTGDGTFVRRHLIKVPYLPAVEW